MRRAAIPQPLLIKLLQVYGGFLAVGCLFGGIAFVLGAGPYRLENAALVFILIVAVGTLFMLYFVGQVLVSQGVAKRYVFGMWAVMALLPAIIVFVNLPWGSLLFALLVPLMLAVLWEPKRQ